MKVLHTSKVASHGRVTLGSDVMALLDLQVNDFVHFYADKNGQVRLGKVSPPGAE